MECLGNTYKYTTATPIRNRLFFTSLRFDFVFFFVIFWRFSVAGAPTIGRFCCDWMRSPVCRFRFCPNSNQHTRTRVLYFKREKSLCPGEKVLTLFALFLPHPNSPNHKTKPSKATPRNPNKIKALKKNY